MYSFNSYVPMQDTHIATYPCHKLKIHSKFTSASLPSHESDGSILGSSAFFKGDVDPLPNDRSLSKDK